MLSLRHQKVEARTQMHKQKNEITKVETKR
jgi:hypothetical protein